MIHFVYASTPDVEEIHSPHTITTNLYNFLRTKSDVKYYEWSYRGVADVGPDDIFIGHPNYDQNTVTHRTLMERQCRLKCMIHPFHTRLPEHNFPFDCLVDHVDKIFAICGPYWHDTIEQTKFARWKSKMIRLDMAVNADHFPFLRTSFNEIGSRELVYIGSTTPMKNLGFMTALMQKIPTTRLRWWGGHSEHPLSRLPNVKTVGWQKLTEDVAKNIVRLGDIFISTSVSDANPTTLLESMAWGLITACTKESGYWKDPLFTELFLDDIDATVSTLQKVLNTPDEALMARAVQGREAIETKYTWNVFCNKIWQELQPYVDS